MTHETPPTPYELLGAAIHDATTAQADKAVDAAMHLALSDFDVLSEQADMSNETKQRVHQVTREYGIGATVAATDIARTMSNRETEEATKTAKLGDIKVMLGRADRLGVEQHTSDFVTRLQRRETVLENGLTNTRIKEHRALTNIKQGLRDEVRDRLLDDPFTFWRYEAPEAPIPPTPSASPMAPTPAPDSTPEAPERRAVAPEPAAESEPVISNPEPIEPPRITGKPASSMGGLRATIAATHQQSGASSKDGAKAKAEALASFLDPDASDAKEAGTERPPFSVGVAEKAYPGHGEDASLVDEDLGLFGVFDGMGSGKDPKLASGTAARAIQEAYAGFDSPVSIAEARGQMKQAFAEALAAVAATGVPNNVTTAVVTKMLDLGGRNYAVFGNAGDSRSFISRADGTFESVTEDQSDGNRIHNGLGLNGDGSVASEWGASNEVVVKELHRGDRIMLCSDGITGDWEDEFLSDSEMARAFSQPNAELAAQEFIRISKKPDDKTVVVVDIEGGDSAASARRVQEESKLAPVPRTMHRVSAWAGALAARSGLSAVRALRGNRGGDQDVSSTDTSEARDTAEAPSAHVQSGPQPIRKIDEQLYKEPLADEPLGRNVNRVISEVQHRLRDLVDGSNPAELRKFMVYDDGVEGSGDYERLQAEVFAGIQPGTPAYRAARDTFDRFEERAARALAEDEAKKRLEAVSRAS